VPVTQVIGYIVQPGESVPPRSEASLAAPAAAQIAPAVGGPIAAGRFAADNGPVAPGKLRATPAARRAARGDLAAEISARIAAAIRAGQLPAQDAALTAAALIGALHEGLIGPLAPGDLADPNRKREAIQSMTLCALRAVGIVDARARGLVVQTTVPAATPSV